MTLHVYGIPNCDTIKRARGWLAERGRDHVFHDYKTEGADPDLVRGWVLAVGWEALLNRRGTTFRALEPEQKEDLDAEKAIRLMIAQPSCIKRPVVVHPGGVLVGFDADRWERSLA